MDPLCINEVNINGNKIKLVEQFKYLGEIIHHHLDENSTQLNRTNKLKKAQFLTWSTYNKKCLSIKSKIRHYNSVVLPEALYACETLFHIKNNTKTDKLLKIERRIMRTCINKSYQKDGVWRIATNETVYSNMKPIISVMKKRRISHFFHILRMPDSRTLKQLVVRNINRRTQGIYVTQILKDLQEIGLRIEDAPDKIKINKILRTNKFNIERPERRRTVEVSDEVRKQRSDRMKEYCREKLESRLVRGRRRD